MLPMAQCALAAAQSSDEGPLDTVVVEGTRSELDHLRQQMVLIEDKFYERYNQLNPNHDFDTHCHIEARVTTRITRRYCRAVYQEQAQEREGQDHSEAMKKMINGRGFDANGEALPLPWVPPAPAAIVIEARRKEYQQNIRDVVNHNPELVEMLRERYELGQRYEASRRKIWGKTPPGAAAVETPAPVPP
jgi:hypothetical protein